MTFILLITVHCTGYAQLRTDSLSILEKAPDLNKPRLYAVGSTGVLLLGGSYMALDKLWYSEYPRSSFHLFNDNHNWLAMDKAGHFMASYYMGYVGQELFIWTGLPRPKAVWVGGTVGLLFLTGVEVLDGHSQEWGFSWVDMAANASGTALLAGQELLWQEQRIVAKFSFHQTSYASVRPDLLGEEWYEHILKDYNGQTYWLSANIHDLTGWREWPQWLNLAVGYGADGMVSADYQPSIYQESGYKWQRQYYLSLDIDLRKIPVKNSFLKGVFKAINFIKVPMPTLEFNQKGKPYFYPLYF